MSDLPSVGKGLLVLGVILGFLGIILMVSGKIPFLGRLPGDIHVERPNFSFYFPLTTCFFLSIFLSFIFWVFSKFK